MRINGVWQTCDDDVVRPVIRGQIGTGNGRWLATWFLVDTGADCTVICADDLLRLGLSFHTNHRKRRLRVPPLSPGRRLAMSRCGTGKMDYVESQVSPALLSLPGVRGSRQFSARKCFV